MAGTYTILICDDEPSTRFGLRDSFAWAGLNIQPLGVAGDGEEALDIVFQCNPDIVLTDVRMPFMDGLEFVTILKSMGFAGKVVFMSAYGEVDYLKKAFTLDAIDYVLKPISTKELHEVMTRVVDKLDAEQAQASRLRRSLPHLREQFLATLVRGLPPDFDDPWLEADALGLSFVPGEAFRLWMLDVAPGEAEPVLSRAREHFSTEALVTRLSDTRLIALVPERLFASEEWTRNLEALVEGVDQGARPPKPWFRDAPDLESVAEAYVAATAHLNQTELRTLESAEHGEGSGSPGEHPRLVVERVKALVKENAKQGLSVRWLAKEVALSHTYLCNLFKKQTGLTLGEYQTQVKIDLAKELLADHRKKSYEVGYDVGYNNPGYFARTFKRVTGMSPIEYRDSVIAGHP